MGLNIGRHLSIHCAAMFFLVLGSPQSMISTVPRIFPGANRELFQGFMACSRGILTQGQQVLAEGSNRQYVRGEMLSRNLLL